MLKIETYIAPLFMSYVDKYIKNLKPSDLSLSLWGGDVVLYNLDLKLDVLEKELKLPISFLSGKIHKLQIHVPWTSLGSDPVEVTINTIECVVQLKDPAFLPEEAENSTPVKTPSASLQHDQVKGTKTQGESPPSGYVQSLLNRVINNVSIQVHNVILKYVEDDIVLSLNLKSVEMFSVNDKWEKAFVDVAAPEFVLRKVCNISDLTICLDKRNSSGQIEMYQDPLLYRCCLNCRILINYDQHLQPTATKLNVYCECLEISLTDQQLSLFIRLLKLCISLYYGTLDLPGCDFKPHPAAQMIQQSISRTKTGAGNLAQSADTSSMPTSKGEQALQEDWANWMWSFVPTLVDEGQIEDGSPRPPQPPHLISMGVYISQVTVSIKLTEKISEGLFFGAQRFEFKPMINLELSGTAIEITLKGEDFFDAQLGVTAVMGWNIGDCVCAQLVSQHIREKSEEEADEIVEEKEEMFLRVGSSLEGQTDPSGFLRGSLFDNGSQSTFELPELVFEADKFLEGHSEEHALRRFGAVFFDYLYTMEIEADRNTDDAERTDIEDVNRITLVHEASHKRLLLAGIQLQCSSSLLHRLELIYKYAFDDLPPRKEKSDVFYDEFVEKQLLAGNIPSRYFNITLASVLVTIPAADHGEPHPLHRETSQQSSDTTLHSIQEQEEIRERGPQTACIVQVERLELQRTFPMYPAEMTKLIVANVDYPAGQNMLRQACNRSCLKAYSVQAGLSQLSQVGQESPLLNIIPPFSSALLFRDSILPGNWGQPYMVRHDAKLEVPLLSIRLTKPQLLLLNCFVASWFSCIAKNEKVPDIPKAVIASVFHKNAADTEVRQPLLEVSVSDTDLQLCETAAVLGLSGSVGVLQARMHSQAQGVLESTVLLYGPTDTSTLYTDQMFKSHMYRENPVENVTPVLSFTVQLPNVWRVPGPEASQGPSSTERGVGTILFHLKGIAVSLDSVLYSWISYNPPDISLSQGTGAERRGPTRHKSLTRTGSVTTPRKKSYARGYGSATSPSREKSQRTRSDDKNSKQVSTEQAAHKEEAGQTFESWLYDQLPLITSLALQGEIKSVVVFMPESNITRDSDATSILRSYSLLYSTGGPLPSALVLCLPSIILHSANHKPMAVRQELPLKLRVPFRKETLPWTLTANNLSIYSIHRRARQSQGGGEKFSTITRYILSPVSSTAVLASAKTSSATSPAPIVPQMSRELTVGGGMSGRRTSLLGFCVHTDFKPVVVSCSTKQVKLICGLTQIITACISDTLSSETKRSAPATESVPPTPVGTRKRLTSATSSSAADQVEVESASAMSDSQSSISFMQVHQSTHQVRVSLWLQWTLPRFVVNLYGKQSGGSQPSAAPVCVSAELEDLTASIDYKDMQLQMQCKLGAFNITHSFKRIDGTWSPGRFNGVFVSCSDIISLKSPFLKLSRVSRLDSSGPHGFLTVMYKRSSLHLKRRKSSPDKESKEPLEDCFKDQHEIRVTMEPLDVVLWMPVVVSAVEVFDPALTLVLDSFLQNQSIETKFQSSQNPITAATSKADSARNVTLNADLLPLIFLNMRDLRVFVPSDGAFESCFQQQSWDSKAACSDDMMLLHLQTVGASPHPDNPNSRLVLQKDMFEKFRKFGRGTRQALGYDVNEIQYQLDVGGFAVWSGSWEQLCGNPNGSADGDDSIPLMDQNPALEWNTQLWRGKNNLHVTPVVVSTDFRLVVAPPIKLMRGELSSGESVTICGCSLELNVLTDVECYLNKKQIQLLQTIAMENINTISSGIISKFDRASGRPGKSCDTTPFNPSNQASSERLDSGFESLYIRSTKQLKRSERKNTDHALSEPTSSEVPVEVLITGRKLLARVYVQSRGKPLVGAQDPSRSPRVRHQTRKEMRHILPVVQVQVVHPAVIVNTYSKAPKIQVTCYDVTVSGADPEQDPVSRLIPESADFKVEWLKSGPGKRDIHSGIMPSLLTVDIHDFLRGPVGINIDIGRPLFVHCCSQMLKQVDSLMCDLSTPRYHTEPTHGSDNKPRASLPLGSVGFSTSEVTLEIEMIPHKYNPKVMASFYCMKAHANLNPADKGETRRIDAGLEMDGVALRTSLQGQYRTLVCPCSFTSDVEMVWSPHSLDSDCQSGFGLPHLYVWLDVGFLQVNCGQEHLKCLNLLLAMLKEYQPSTTTNVNSSDPNESKAQEVPDVSNSVAVAMNHSVDDIRAGPFKYIKASGMSDDLHPRPYEIVFSAVSSERPPSMTWRYSEPRALTALEVLPLPLSSPILVNTLNMGDEYQVPCVLRYWDNIQKCYITYRSFFLLETSPSSLSFPDPVTSNPAEIMVAEEWQIVVDVAPDIEYPDENSPDEDEAASSYSSPYHSLISATSLAASVKVNSVFSPQFIPAICLRGSVGIVEARLVNHMRSTDRVFPKALQGYTIDPSVPTEQELMSVTIEGLSGLAKHVGGKGAFSLAQMELNCRVDIMDFGDVTYHPLLSPFDVAFTAAVFHDAQQTIDKGSSSSSTEPTLWLDAALDIQQVLMHIQQSTVHTVSMTTVAWQQNGEEDAENVIPNHYIICNDTREVLRFGQVKTDESLVLGNRQVHPYSWRTPRSTALEPRLQVCIETEGDWRWSEPIDIDTVGVCSRTIHHRLHSATLFIEVKPLNGVQKQVVICGSHTVVSHLSVDVEVQILKNPSLSQSSQPHASPFQVLESILLPSHTTLPSYIVSHGGLSGMRIRIPNCTTWSDSLPLDSGEQAQQEKNRHLIVRLLGVKEFQTFNMWYNVERNTTTDQVKISLSPLFIVRSHLAESVLMKIVTANSNETAVIPTSGRGHEQQIFNLGPNVWHHVTFQFGEGGRTSNPPVPLNTTLIELANRMKAEEAGEEEDSLVSLWPYCRLTKQEGNVDDAMPSSAESALLRNVMSPAPGPNERARVKTASEASTERFPAVPDIELQCRVVKRWPTLSTLVVDIVPWCLLVNNTSSDLYIKDLDRDVVLYIPKLDVVAPHRLQSDIQLGTACNSSLDIRWSEAVPLPTEFNASYQQDRQFTEDRGLPVTVAFVRENGEACARQLVMCSSYRRGIHVLFVDERYCMINTTDRQLVVYPVLVSPDKKVAPHVSRSSTIVHLSASSTTPLPVELWDVPTTSSVVLDGEGNALLGDTRTVLFFALADQDLPKLKSRWSRAVHVTSELPRQMTAVPSADGKSSHAVVIATEVVSGVVHVVVASDPSPRLILFNNCPFTLQFGQAIPPQSPSYKPGSKEKIVVLEQTDPYRDVPEVMPFSSTHYELPVMKEWFSTVSQVQRLPPLHFQAMYNVSVAEIAEQVEDGSVEESFTEVPQGWSQTLDIGTTGDYRVNLPGRGQVRVVVSQQGLCTRLYIDPMTTAKQTHATVHQPLICEARPAFALEVSITRFGVVIVDEVSNIRCPVELLRLTVGGVELSHRVVADSDVRDPVSRNEVKLVVNSVQLDNQLVDDLYEFAVVLMPSNPSLRLSTRKRPHRSSSQKHLLTLRCLYEANVNSDMFIHSLNIAVEPLTVFIEDTLLYRLVGVVGSFIPSLSVSSTSKLPAIDTRTHAVLQQMAGVINPLVIGWFRIEAVNLCMTCHGSVKLFVAVDDSPLSLASFEFAPVYAAPGVLMQKLLYHYATSALFKAGWVLGSLELLGNPAGLVRSLGQGVSDFFYLPYDGLTRGPGAFVTGVTRGMSSFIRHLSTGTLTSITHLASSMSRNMDRLCMDEAYRRMQEEQRCNREPKQVLTGFAQGLSGFGLSLLGAVAGIVDQPIQGIQRASDAREMASSVITGVGKGLLGVITKPIGGAMELVSQTGQGILQGTGLSKLPDRLFPVGESLMFCSKNSQLKYSWKILRLACLQPGTELLVCVEATIITSSGNEYEGAVLLSADTLYTVSLAGDTVQQSMRVMDVELLEDEEDTRGLVLIVNQQIVSMKEGAEGVEERPDTGDPERLEQFLRDAQALSRTGMTPSEGGSEFSIPSGIQRFLVLVDPVLRHSLVLQFNTLKSKMAAVTETDIAV